MNNYEKAKDKCNMLINQKFQYIGRTCEIIYLGFGDTFIRENSKGEKREIAKYSIHIQCPFRIYNKHGIILGTDDLYIPANNNEIHVDLDKQNSTNFDYFLEKINKQLLENEYVRNINIQINGDLFIIMQNFTFSLFIASFDHEAWRLFETNTEKEHLVISGNKIDFV